MSNGNSTFIPFDDEFLINSTTLNAQEYSSIAALAGGGFVATWTDLSGTSVVFDGYDVRGQRFHADGSKLGAEFVVNTTTQSYQRESNVVALDGGGFVVTWRDDAWGHTDDNSTGVRAQVFAANGSKLGDEFLVNTQTDGTQYLPTITALSGDNFVVVWMDYNVSNGRANIKAQIFSDTGLKIGSEFLVNATTAGSQSEPEVAVLSSGGFVITWTDNSKTGDDISLKAVRSQVFQSDGTKIGSETLVNTITGNDQYESTVAGLENGRFVIAWADASASGGDTSGQAVRAQIFNADGSKSGDEFLVNTSAASHQVSPVMISLSTGGFVIGWMDFSHGSDDPSGTAVRAQLFDSAGAKVGTEFLVNDTTAGNQFSINIAELADGRIAFSWTDASASGGDISGSAIRGQIFDARTAGVDLQGTKYSDELIGTGFDDTIGGESGRDTLVGADGNDRLFGHGGKDVLRGGAGNDVLDGGSKKDMLFGDQGADVLYGRAGHDMLKGSVGADRLYGGNGRDRLFGGEQKDKLWGGKGTDKLVGGSGNDRLFGGGGDDVLIGGKGRDFHVGGKGEDQFVFLSPNDSRGRKTDIIKDFDHGVDEMDFSAMMADNAQFVGTAGFSGTAAEVRIVTKANGTAVVQVDADGDGRADARVFLEGLNAAEIAALDSDDFIL